MQSSVQSWSIRAFNYSNAAEYAGRMKARDAVWVLLPK